MSYRDLSTVQEPVLKRLKVDNDSKRKDSKIDTNVTKVNYSQLENLPYEILLQIFEQMNPKIKELILLSHVCRRMRLVAHDQSLWQNVNLFPKSKSAGLLKLVLENGCKRLQACSQTVGTLKLNQESRLEFFSTWHTDHRIIEILSFT